MRVCVCVCLHTWAIQVQRLKPYISSVFYACSQLLLFGNFNTFIQQQNKSMHLLIRLHCTGENRQFSRALDLHLTITGEMCSRISMVADKGKIVVFRKKNTIQRNSKRERSYNTSAVFFSQSQYTCFSKLASLLHRLMSQDKSHHVFENSDNTYYVMSQWVSQAHREMVFLTHSLSWKPLNTSS